MTALTDPTPADIGSAEADLDPSTDRYARRFEGPAGSWLLDRQTAILREMMSQFDHARVLDIGGGHGQIAGPLTQDGHAILVHASSKRALSRVAEMSGVETATGSLTSLPYPDACFDVVTSFRILAHIGDWEQLLSEACRVARHAVIVDYPSPGGFNRLEPVLFGLKKRLEGDTRRYKTLRTAQIRKCLSKAGFGSITTVGQFSLPMVLHRRLRSPALSNWLEAGFRAAGHTRRLGSPVILSACRSAQRQT